MFICFVVVWGSPLKSTTQKKRGMDFQDCVVVVFFFGGGLEGQPQNLFFKHAKEKGMTI